jgi:hypothetical protein
LQGVELSNLVLKPYSFQFRILNDVKFENKIDSDAWSAADTFSFAANTYNYGSYIFLQHYHQPVMPPPIDPLPTIKKATPAKQCYCGEQDLQYHCKDM